MDMPASNQPEKITPNIRALVLEKLQKERTWICSQLIEVVKKDFGIRVGREAMRLRILSSLPRVLIEHSRAQVVVLADAWFASNAFLEGVHTRGFRARRPQCSWSAFMPWAFGVAWSALLVGCCGIFEERRKLSEAFGLELLYWNKA